MVLVRLFLRQVFLDLPDIGIAFSRQRKDASDIQGPKVEAGLLLLRLKLGKQTVVFDRVIDGHGREQRVEPAPAGGGVMLGEDGLNDGFFRKRFARLRRVLAVRFEVVNVEAEDVCILDGVRNCVGVQSFLK